VELSDSLCFFGIQQEFVANLFVSSSNAFLQWFIVAAFDKAFAEMNGRHL
jgi:hypothetical protein